MNTLITRNIGFGLLMTLVLAFGVQGTADALTFSTSKTGDLEKVFPNQEFKITFTPSPDSPELKNKDLKVIPGAKKSDTNYYYTDDNGRDGYQDSTHSAVVDGTISADTLSGTFADNNYYDQETFTITPSNASIIKVGNHEVNVTSASSHNMYESTHASYDSVPASQRFSSSSITLTLRASSAAEVEIVIRDASNSGDRKTGETAKEITFTVYVVEFHQNISDRTTVLGTTTTKDSVEYAYDPDVRQLNGDANYFKFSDGSGDSPVHYSLDGPGSFFIRKVYTGANAASPSSEKRISSKTFSTSRKAPVFIDMKQGTNKVTASIPSGTPKSTIFIYSGPTSDKYPRIEITQGNNQTGAAGGRLENYLEVKVTDGNRHAVLGVAVRFTTTGSDAYFIPFPGTEVYGNNTNLAGTVAESINDTTFTATLTEPAKKGGPVFIQTDRSGLAKVYYELGTTPNPQTITATLYQAPFTVDVPFTARLGTTGSERVANLEIVSGNPQSAAKGKDLAKPLVVIARSTAGYRIPNVVIQFRTGIGIFSRHGLTKSPLFNGHADDTDGTTLQWGEIPANTPNPDTGQQIYVRTSSDGQASVNYNIGQFDLAREVSAEIRHEPLDSDYSFAIKRVTFEINGTGSTTTPPTTQQPQQPQATTFTVSPTSISGAAGSTQTLTVNAPAGTLVRSSSNIDFVTAGGSVSPSTRTGSGTFAVTLPSTAGTYSLSVISATDSETVSVTVTGATTPTTQTGTLSISVPFSGAIGSQQVATVTATGSDGNPASGVAVSLSVTNGGGVFSPASVTTGTNGTAVSTLTRSTTAGTNYFVKATATGYTEALSRISITGATTTTPTTTPTTPTTPTVSGSPSRIQINGQATRSGTVNQALSTPFVVEVLDSKGVSVEDVRVIFRVRSGQGRLTQRGNGRAIAVQTDSRGYARATYTPMSANSTVVASVGGVSETVTFTITADGSVPATTPGTTTPIDPKILVGAANRPAMFWIDNGMLYGLTGAEATKIAENVNGAALGGGKVYWTEKTGASAGTINSANLDGDTSTTKLATIMAVPMGIAVDTAGKKLYWTNSRGRVQSANLNGSGIRNVQQNLSSPSDIALGNGHIYWTEDGSSIRRVNMTGTKVVKDIAVGLTDVGGIAVGGGKVYWTEKTGASAGTINGANLDGTQFKTLATIKAVPMGIAVDTVGKKLYWTNSRGRVQSGTLSAGMIRNVVDGLGTPSHLAIGSASQGTTAAKPATQPATQPTKKDTSAYDVNGDGTVDNVDASLVADAMGTDNQKYDVNADGTVNFFDLMLVFDNRDEGAAGAPTIVGMQLSSVQRAVIAEQIDLLIATGDRSPAAMRTLIYLQQLLATARPEKTQLLANYPNPFNPETWIPYELATDTDVRITIYNAQGVMIRTLQLGQQSAGYYTDRERAAYWDGRNALGEQVASGLYFYQLETDTMSSMRKMVILK